jgi:hypothetical protein
MPKKRVVNYGIAMKLPSLKNNYKSRMPEKIDLIRENKVYEMKRKESLAALKQINYHYSGVVTTNPNHFERG